MTTDKNIRKLINKFDKHQRKSERKDKSVGNLVVKDIDKYSFLRMLDYTPPRPPKTFGMMEKMGKLVFNFHERYIEVDPVVGSFRRFKTKEDYPRNPL